MARFWPVGEGREARTWVIENITGGRVPTARAKLRFGPGELGRKPLPEHANGIIVLFKGSEFLAQLGDLMIVARKVDLGKTLRPLRLLDRVDSTGERFRC